MIAIEPPAELSEKIRIIQRKFSETFGSAAALKPPVHITFKPPFRIDSELQKDYEKSVEGFCKNQKSLVVELNGFRFFKRNRVAFIFVTRNDILEKMYYSFESSEEKNKKPYHAHITIGYRNLSDETFKEIMKFYRDLPFYGSFPVNGLNLWTHNGKAWKNISFFPFGKRGQDS